MTGAVEVLPGALVKVDTCIKCGRKFAYAFSIGRKKYCSECSRLVTNERNTKYFLTPKGKAARLRELSRFYSTPKGKVSRAKMVSKRRERSTDPESYAARVELLHTLQESCTSCQAPYRITHQIDHILALCLGGTDQWENLQPLCLTCHRRKTTEDNRKLVRENRRQI